jgi:hypothetical protein
VACTSSREFKRTMYWLQRGWGTHTLFSKSRASQKQTFWLPIHTPTPTCAFVAWWHLWLCGVVDSAQDCEVVSHLHYNSCQYQTTPQHPVSEFTRSLISITISPTQQR